MKHQLKTGLFLLCVLTVNTGLFAQTDDWKTDKTKDGKVEVSYIFSESVDEKGKKFNVLEYVASTTAEVSLESCKAVMRNDSLHMGFMDGTENVHRIADLPDGEWVTYYFYNSPWPMPDADVITRYKLEEESSKKRFFFTGTPAPDMYPEGDVPRMKHNDTKYTFTDLGNGQVEIIMYSKSIPLVSVPKWVIATWIPNGPADMLNGIVRLAGEDNNK
ncbi:MAG: hypothetical protein QNK35_05190 [Bacteroides sp.]|nr:hypothetical protein [Bacteroides sp.]